MSRLAKQFKGEACRDAGHSLFNGRPHFLPGRSQRVSFVANSIQLNVNQPNPKHMTMPICLLDHGCVYPVDRIYLVHHVVYSRHSSDGSLRSGSIGSGSLEGRSRYIDPHRLCVNTIMCSHDQVLHTQGGSWSIFRFSDRASTVGSPTLLGPRMFDDLGDQLLQLAPIFTYLPLSLAIQYSGWFPPLGWSGPCNLVIQARDRGSRSVCRRSLTILLLDR